MSTIRFDGLETVLESIEDIADVNGIKSAMGKCCALVERSAKQNAPKDTGNLRNSITSEVRLIDGAITGVVYTPLEYAPYVEYGTGLFAEEGGRSNVPWKYQDDEGNWHSTSGQKPQPFMRPALNENRNKIKQILQEGVNNG